MLFILLVAMGHALEMHFYNGFTEGGVVTEELNVNYDNQEEKYEINNGKSKFMIEDYEIFEVKFE